MRDDSQVKDGCFNTQPTNYCSVKLHFMQWSLVQDIEFDVNPFAHEVRCHCFLYSKTVAHGRNSVADRV